MTVDLADDATLLCRISVILLQSATHTDVTMAHTKQFLDYVATQEEAVMTFNASDMKLAAHSDVSYLSEPKARSRTGGFFPFQAMQLHLTITVPSSTLRTSSNMQ